MNTLSKGESFGEIGLIRETERTASVVCQTDCFFLTLHKCAYNDILSIVSFKFVHFLSVIWKGVNWKENHLIEKIRSFLELGKGLTVNNPYSYGGNRSCESLNNLYWWR